MNDTTDGIGPVDALLDKVEVWLRGHKRARNSIVSGSAVYALSASAFGVWYYPGGVPLPLGLSIVASVCTLLTAAPSFGKRDGDN